MVKNVVYLEIAVNDLKSIYQYISKDSVKYAKLEVHKIKASAESLKSHPLKGKFYQTIKGKDIRSIVSGRYLIFYINDDDQISILTIHHQSRLLSNNLAFKEEEYFYFGNEKTS